MTIEEVRALVAAAKASSIVIWDGVVAVEEATGPLKALNDKYDASLRLYDLALEQLAKQSPSTEDARLLLSGAKNYEALRGGSQSATEALVALTLYTEAPYHGESYGSSYAAAVSVST